MARRKRVPGVRQRVKTSRATYTKQHQKNGRTVYRKNGRFVSKRSYVAAKAYKGAEVEATDLQTRGSVRNDFSRTSDTKWIQKGDKAGPYAVELFPELSVGDKMTTAQLKVVRADKRYVHGFELFWIKRLDLSRAEAEDQYQEMIDKLRRLKSATAREAVRVEFGLDGGSGFDKRRAQKERSRKRAA